MKLLTRGQRDRDLDDVTYYWVVGGVGDISCHCQYPDVQCEYATQCPDCRVDLLNQITADVGHGLENVYNFYNGPGNFFGEIYMRPQPSGRIRIEWRIARDV